MPPSGRRKPGGWKRKKTGKHPTTIWIKKKKPHYKGTEKVQAALTEQQAAALFGLGYSRFASTDHTWPEPAEVDAFLQWQKNLPADAWLHFHCQAGKGRTTAYMIMRDIWLNGQQDSLETICARQHAWGDRMCST